MPSAVMMDHILAHAILSPAQEPPADTHAVMAHARLVVVVSAEAQPASLRDWVAQCLCAPPRLTHRAPARHVLMTIAKLTPESLRCATQCAVARRLIACHRPEQLRQVRIAVHTLDGRGRESTVLPTITTVASRMISMRTLPLPPLVR